MIKLKNILNEEPLNESVNEKRGFVTKMLNKKLTIKRIGSRERFKDTKSGKVFKKDGFAFHIPGKGYIGYRDEKGMPYTPGGGKKALQQILDDGGFLDYKKLVLINPVDESINEGPSTEEKRIAMLAVRKQAKYRNVDLVQAIQDQINALMDLQRDVKRGKKIK